MKNKDWMKPTPSPRLQELLGRVEEVSKGRFVILPESGQPRVASFDAMTIDERFSTLRDHIDWNRYVNNGVSIEQAERIMNNALAGLPRERWLEQTSDRVVQARDRNEREM